MKKYERLKKIYPDYISLDQLYRICRISKRSALYLIQNGIIPYLDTGKKTWRYKIALDDVITYLRKREQWGSMIPKGAVSSLRSPANNPRKAFADFVARGEERAIAEYFNYIFDDIPDVLTITDVSEMTGFDRETIRRHIKAGAINRIEVGKKWFIPKTYFFEFIVSESFVNCKSNSETFIKVLGGYEIWKTAKS